MRVVVPDDRLFDLGLDDELGQPLRGKLKKHEDHDQSTHGNRGGEKAAPRWSREEAMDFARASVDMALDQLSGNPHAIDEGFDNLRDTLKEYRVVDDGPGYGTVTDAEAMYWQLVEKLKKADFSKGGPGSGNFGHAGRPGEVGGSAPGDGESLSAGTRESMSRFVNFDTALTRLEKVKEGLEWRNAMYQAQNMQEKPAVYVPPVRGQGFAGVPEEDIRKAFSAEKVSVYMAMSRATAMKILGGDAIKNSLETGKGTFKIIGEERAKKEKEALGVAADITNPEGFPKYGFVSNKGGMSDDGIVAFGYGNVYLEFKDSIRERTTATIGDSYNNNSGTRYRIPAPLDEMGGEQFYGDDPGGSPLTTDGMARFKENPGNGDVRSLADRAEYVEAQIYGRLSIADVKSIHVESKKDAAAIEKALRKGGLDVQVVPTNSHTYLKQLDNGILKAWEKVAPQDIARLGDEYIKHGWNSGMTGSNVWGKGWQGERAKFNLPKTLAAIEKYPSPRDVPLDLQREIMVEYATEARKGKDGTLDKVLWSTKTSAQDNFTLDVFNEKLLEKYPS